MLNTPRSNSVRGWLHSLLGYMVKLGVVTDTELDSSRIGMELRCERNVHPEQLHMKV